MEVYENNIYSGQLYRYARSKKWVKRIFILASSGELYWIQKKNSGLPRQIDIKGGRINRIDDRSFELIVPGGKATRFKGDSKTDIDEWMQQIGDVLSTWKEIAKTTFFQSLTPPHTGYKRSKLKSSGSSQEKRLKSSAGSGSKNSKIIGNVTNFLRDFKKVKVVGQGGFAEVYLVEQISTGAFYAMKKINKDRLREQDRVQNTFTELKVLTQIDNPFLTKAHYAFQSEKNLFLIMDFVNGGDIFYHLQRSGYFMEEIAQFYIAEIILGLECLHNHNIIYRDLKPENLIIRDDGHITLIDFGISKEVSEITDSVVGTSYYMSPEIINQSGYSFEADWWALGVLLYELITGRQPFKGECPEAVFDQIMWSDIRFPHNKHISNAAKHLILSLTVKDINRRLTDLQKIKAHAFFDTIDWNLLSRKECQPPYFPNVKNSSDTKHIDPEFLRLSVSIEVSDSPRSEDTSTFKEFHFDPDALSSSRNSIEYIN